MGAVFKEEEGEFIGGVIKFVERDICVRHRLVGEEQGFCPGPWGLGWLTIEGEVGWAGGDEMLLQE